MVNFPKRHSKFQFATIYIHTYIYIYIIYVYTYHVYNIYIYIYVKKKTYPTISSSWMVCFPQFKLIFEGRCEFPTLGAMKDGELLENLLL